MNFITDFNGGEKVQRPDFACMAECNCVLQTRISMVERRYRDLILRAWLNVTVSCKHLLYIMKALKCKPSACLGIDQSMSWKQRCYVSVSYVSM